MLNNMRGEFTVIIDTKKVKCVLNLNAFRLLSQKFKVGLQDLDVWLNKEPLEALPGLAYCAAVNAAVREGKPGPGEYEAFASKFFDADENIEAVTNGIEAAFGSQDDEGGKQ